jgi:thiol-disulfide isomerase/thioredoxin
MRLVVSALLFLLALADSASAQSAQLARFASGDLAKLSFKQAGTPALPVAVMSKTGSVTLAQYKGKVVLMNLWATWCAPCLKEMPGLDRLAGSMPAQDVVVLAISQDQAGWRAVDPWWSKAKLQHLVPLIDKKMQLGFGLGAAGLPVTVIYDRKGREVARLNGTAEWDSANARALLKAVAAQK